MLIGLTGPIAAGKNEAARILKRRGAFIIDADKIAHELYAFQSPLWNEIVRAFGSKILLRGGKINRRKLAEIVFADEKKLARLNKIAHPYLKDEIIKRVESCKLIVINAALLKEIGLVDYVDEVWVVTAAKETRLKRLMKKGLSKTEAQSRINSQPSQEEYLDLADRVIKNDGTLRQLKRQLSQRF